MKSSIRDNVEGKMHQVKGKIKEVAGKIFGNRDSKDEKLNGQVQEKVGRNRKVADK